MRQYSGHDAMNSQNLRYYPQRPEQTDKQNGCSPAITRCKVRKVVIRPTERNCNEAAQEGRKRQVTRVRR